MQISIGSTAGGHYHCGTLPEDALGQHFVSGDERKIFLFEIREVTCNEMRSELPYGKGTGNIWEY